MYRSLAKLGCKIIFIPSAFTKTTGKAHWLTLVKARAIENQSYTIGVNRIGVDGSGVFFNGNSLALDAFGVELIKTSLSTQTYIITLRKHHIKSTREKINFLNDRDKIKLINFPN